MQTKKSKRKGNQKRPMRCPYCGANVVYRSADGIYKENKDHTMLYVCGNYPECDAYVRAHAGSGKPMGSLADHRLRKLRKLAHESFDRLYLSGRMTRQDAYQWLADILDAPMSEAHIGHMGEYYCNQVIKKSREIMGDREQTGRTASRESRKEVLGNRISIQNRSIIYMMGGDKHETKCHSETESRRKCGAGA